MPVPIINEGASAPVAGELFRASGLTLNSSTNHIAANVADAVTGQSGQPIDISQVSNGLLVVSVGGIAGTSPTLAVFFEVQDAFGNWVLVSNAVAISGAVLTSTGTTYGNISSGYTLTKQGRIRWTVGGTTPSFTGVSFSLWGR